MKIKRWKFSLSSSQLREIINLSLRTGVFSHIWISKVYIWENSILLSSVQQRSIERSLVNCNWGRIEYKNMRKKKFMELKLQSFCECVCMYWHYSQYFCIKLSKKKEKEAKMQWEQKKYIKQMVCVHKFFFGSQI